MPRATRSLTNDSSSESRRSTYVVVSFRPSWTVLRKILEPGATIPLSSVSTIRAERASSAKGEAARIISARIRIAAADASTVPSVTRASNHSRTVARDRFASSRMWLTLPGRNSPASTDAWIQFDGRPG